MISTSIYLDGERLGPEEQEARVLTYWRPYHERISGTLKQIRDQFGYALLWDAHSIPSEVPLLFDGVLPDLNIGTNKDRSCATEITTAVEAVAEASPYSSVTNGRFRGGHITRSHGAPGDGVHAMQLELTQRNYMDEKNLSYDAGRALNLAGTIKSMLQAFETAVKNGT
jgi:N-formylglutamate amidohydrolase